VRENGGQYTHAATWVVAAFAGLGQFDRAAEALDLLNPILAAATPDLARRYAVEPYVLAGDVYGPPAPAGRGGWTWYTGAAGWYYRVVLETILGLELRGSRLAVRPRVTSDWAGFSVRLRYRTAVYAVRVECPSAGRQVREVLCDGERVAGEEIDLRDDGREHTVRVVVG
jgi:cellobiose phosphorylase